jgi:hypothetical protein
MHHFEMLAKTRFVVSFIAALWAQNILWFFFLKVHCLKMFVARQLGLKILGTFYEAALDGNIAMYVLYMTWECGLWYRFPAVNTFRHLLDPLCLVHFLDVLVSVTLTFKIGAAISRKVAP